jgi:hypothetical protein
VILAIVEALLAKGPAKTAAERLPPTDQFNALVSSIPRYLATHPNAEFKLSFDAGVSQ